MNNGLENLTIEGLILTYRAEVRHQVNCIIRDIIFILCLIGLMIWQIILSIKEQGTDIWIILGTVFGVLGLLALIWLISIHMYISVHTYKVYVQKLENIESIYEDICNDVL